jgi:UDP-N-acetylglucosamine--N-acetylmuramyl-(pentapeptide) pyrophosphoryl-undecaprenol N-acetylglucosamine transferase
VLLAARKLGIPHVLLEQNVIPGRVTRHFSRGAARVYSQWEETRLRLPSRTRFLASGSPLRAGFSAVDREQARRTLQTDWLRVTVLGGSQGSRSLNDLVPDSMDHLNGFSGRVEVVHLAGRDDRVRVQSAYGLRKAVVADFSDDMPTLYAASDLIVSRAGALAIAEMARIPRPCILIPYPHAADDHQSANARILAEAGAAVVLEERSLTPQKLAAAVADLLGDEPRRRRMSEALSAFARPDAARTIADDLEALVP